MSQDNQSRAEAWLDSGAIDDAIRECIHGHYWKGCFPCSQQIIGAIVPSLTALLDAREKDTTPSGWRERIRELEAEVAQYREEYRNLGRSVRGFGATDTRQVSRLLDNLRALFPAPTTEGSATTPEKCRWCEMGWPLAHQIVPRNPRHHYYPKDYKGLRAGVGPYCESPVSEGREP